MKSSYSLGHKLSSDNKAVKRLFYTHAYTYKTTALFCYGVINLLTILFICDYTAPRRDGVTRSQLVFMPHKTVTT